MHLKVVLGDVSKSVVLARGLSWPEVCSVIQRREHFPEAINISHLVLLDADGEAYSAPLKSETVFWKIVNKYCDSPEFSFQLVLGEGSGSSNTKGSKIFPVVFDGVTKSVSVTEDGTWDDLVSALSMAFSPPDSSLQISHVQFIDSDGDSLSSKIDSIAKFWKFVNKLRQSFTIKIFVTAVSAEREVCVVKSSMESTPHSTKPTRIFPVVFDGVTKSVSVTEDGTWDDLVSALSMAFSPPDSSLQISHVQFIDSDGDSLSSKIDSIAKFWKFDKKVKGDFSLTIFGSIVSKSAHLVDLEVKSSPTVDLEVKSSPTVDLELKSPQPQHVLNTELWEFCRKGSATGISAVLSNGADVFSCNENGSGPLHFAAVSGNIESIVLLKSLGCRIRTANNKGFTPLHFAVSRGNVDVTLYLLSCGADIYQETHDGLNSLAYMCGRGKIGELSALSRTCKFSLDHLDSRKRSLLHIICNDHGMNPDLIDEILDMGADIELSDGQMRSPLFIACLADNTVAAQKLLRRGALVDIYDVTRETCPIFCACFNGNFSLTVGLVERGASLTCTDMDGNTCLHVAVENGDARIVKYLLELGVPPNQVNKNGMRPNDIAASLAKIEASLVLNNFVGPLNRTTIFLNACAQGNVDYINSLLLCGSDVKTIISANGANGVHVACSAGAIDVADLLSEHGVRINDRISSGLTPFLSCCSTGQVRGMEWLLSKSVDVNEVELSCGNTGLHLAALKSQNGSINCLLQHGADATIRNYDGNTALDLALHVGNTDTAKLLSYETNKILDSIVYSIPGVNSTDTSRKLLAPVAGVINKSTESPVVRSIFDDFLLSFSCVSDSSTVMAPVTFAPDDSADTNSSKQK